MNLNFISPINSFGYGVTGVSMLKALLRTGTKVTLFPLGPIAPEQKDLGIVEKHKFGRLQGTNHYDTDAPMVKNYHEYEMWFPPGKGLKIAWPFFETDSLYRDAVSMLNGCDAVAAGSEWAEGILKSNGVKVPIFRVNQGVNTNIFKPGPRVGEEGLYKFFTLGKFEVRKGHYELIQAFKQAFPGKEDVRLHMMCHNPFIEKHIPGHVVKEIYSLAGNDRRIIVASPVPSQLEVASFINSCDCGVFPSRGEGWGLPILETMACGKPLIATFVTAQTEYLTEKSATRVSTTLPFLANDGMFFKGDRGRWFQAEVHDLAKQMRIMYNERKTDNPEGVKRAKEFSWDRAAGMLVDGVLDLCQG